VITVTDNALKAIKNSMTEESKAPGNAFLRVAVKGGGCSGMMYDLSIVDKSSDDDTLMQYDDVRIIVDKKSSLFLHGLTLDYTTGLNGKGFVFSNPNATGTCGCGESFSA